MPPQKAGRRARLPTVAIALAKHALGERSVTDDTALLFGTTYGAETETEAFVVNMIEKRAVQAAVIQLAKRSQTSADGQETPLTSSFGPVALSAP